MLPIKLHRRCSSTLGRAVTGIRVITFFLNKSVDSSKWKRIQLHFLLLIEASFFNSY